MAGPRFRLQGLLHLAQAQQKQCRAAVAEAVQAEQILRQHLAQVQNQLQQALQQRQPGQGPVDLDRLMEAARYQLVLEAQHRHLQGQLVQLQQELQRRQARLAEANRQVRLLEKLRQRQFQRWQAEQLRWEQQALDELASVHSLRRENP